MVHDSLWCLTMVSKVNASKHWCLDILWHYNLCGLKQRRQSLNGVLMCTAYWFIWGWNADHKLWKFNDQQIHQPKIPELRTSINWMACCRWQRCATWEPYENGLAVRKAFSGSLQPNSWVANDLGMVVKFNPVESRSSHSSGELPGHFTGSSYRIGRHGMATSVKSKYGETKRGYQLWGHLGGNPRYGNFLETLKPMAWPVEALGQDPLVDICNRPNWGWYWPTCSMVNPWLTRG